MKKGASMHVRQLVAGFALTIFAAGVASSAARAADLRVGVVDVRKAVFSSSEGKTAQQQFSKLEDEKMSELRPRQEEVRRLEEEYEKQKFVLSPDALQERRLEIVKRRRDLERDFNEAQDDLQIYDADTLIEEVVERQFRKDDSEFREASIEREEFFATSAYERGFRLILRGKKKRMTFYAFKTKKRMVLLMFQGPAPTNPLTVAWEDAFHEAIVNTVQPWKPAKKPRPSPGAQASPTPGE